MNSKQQREKLVQVRRALELIPVSGRSAVEAMLIAICGLESVLTSLGLQDNEKEED